MKTLKPLKPLKIKRNMRFYKFINIKSFFTFCASVCILNLLFCFKAPDFCGKYGAYSDFSSFTELFLNPDSSFVYHDQTELNGTIHTEGNWSNKENKVFLHDFKNNKLRPLPTTWTLNNNTLISKKTKWANGKFVVLKLEKQ